MAETLRDLIARTDDFVPRHLGPRADDIAAMLKVVGVPDLDALVAEAVPAGIRLDGELDLPRARRH